MVGVRIAECSTSEAAGRRHPPALPIRKPIAGRPSANDSSAQVTVTWFRRFRIV
jgi:hypothetical protein